MRRAMILGFFLLASLAACSSETPTGVSAPERPRYDGGWLVGSGGRSAESGGETTTASDTTTSRTGWLVGSGG